MQGACCGPRDRFFTSSTSTASIAETPTLLVRDVAGHYRAAADAEVLSVAQALLRAQVVGRQVLTSPAVVKDFLMSRFHGFEHEVFAVLLLDAQHAVLDYVELFRGTLTQTSVYPREVVKLALQRNAAALILAHNHPSGTAEPSRADEFLTQTLKQALALVDVRVLDHMVVGRGVVASFAERGLL
jgi:DNA repair protein RadC